VPTVLAADDSVTMRKVFEMTFGGSGYDLVIAATADEALAKLADASLDLVIVEAALDGGRGYEVCEASKARSPGRPVLLLVSRHHPLDGARAASAKADGHLEKPFETQAVLDRVRTFVAPTESAPVPTPITTPAPSTIARVPAPPPPRMSRSKTLAYDTESIAPTGATSSRPAPSLAGVVSDAAVTAKLGALDLTPAQADAVLAISREVVEKVVRELVPALAEKIIREEIARLTK
jgi:DNA-binding response OmpR family regulator